MEPEKTFEEIGNELGISAVRAFQIYKRALNRIGEISDEEKAEILEELANHEPQESFYEQMSDKLLQPDDSDNLRGFWREEHAR